MTSSDKVDVAVNEIGNHNSSESKPNKWNDQPHIGKYKLIKTIGKGNFAKVKLAQHVTTGKKVAVKVIDKTALNNSSLQKLFREVKIMKTLEHPNIVKLFEVIESERHVYLVMEYASKGEVFDFLVQNGRMKENEARQRFREIISAIQYCHHKNIVHRDLKAENLLLCNSLEIKIADFGFANSFDCKKQLDTFCGSPPYAAPELFQGRKYEGPEVDVWSLGVILYTLVSGSLPFDGHNMRELRERVLKGKYRVPFYMSTDCELLLKKMLIVSPQKRYTLLEVMKDKWLNMGYEDSVLQPYVEPPRNYEDPLRLAIMENLGFSKEEVLDSLYNAKFNNVTATYLLLDHDVNNALENNSKSASVSSLKNVTSHLPTKDVLKLKMSDNDKSVKAVTRSGSTVEGKRNIKVATDSGSKDSQFKIGKDNKSQINDTEKNIKAKTKKISNIKQSPSMGTTHTYSNDEVPLSPSGKRQVNQIRIPGNQPKINPIASKLIEDKVELTPGDRLLIPVKGSSSVKRNNTFTYADKNTTSEVESKPVTRTKPVMNMHSNVSPSTPFALDQPITITSNEQASNEIIFQNNTSDDTNAIIKSHDDHIVAKYETKNIKAKAEDQPMANGDHLHLETALFDNNPTIMVAVEEDSVSNVANTTLDTMSSVNNSASHDQDTVDPFPQLTQPKQIHSGSLFRSFTNKISTSKLIRRLTSQNAQVNKNKKKPSEYDASNSADPWTPMTSTVPVDHMKISASSDLSGAKNLTIEKARKTYTLKTNQTKPRLMHLVFRKNITSKLQPDAIISEMLKSLFLIEEIEFKKVEQIDLFVIECVGRLKTDNELIYWEIEVFRLPRSSSFGIRIKKESGSSTRFKAIQKILINKLSPVLCTKDSYMLRP